LLIIEGTKVYVVDVTIPFEKGEDVLKQAGKRKQLRYVYQKAALKRGRIRSATMDAFIIGALGAWDPDNEQILKLVTSTFDRTLFRRLCVSNCIKWSRDIFQKHVEGVGIIGSALPSQLTQ